MRFDEYTHLARKTANYPVRGTFEGLKYNALKLAGEAGEVADQVGKALGKGEVSLTRERRHNLIAEAGDVLWHLAMLCDELGVTLDQIADVNLAKLAARQDAGTLLGGNRSGEVA